MEDSVALIPTEFRARVIFFRMEVLAGSFFAVPGIEATCTETCAW
jgi:hypothetical protein